MILTWLSDKIKYLLGGAVVALTALLAIFSYGRSKKKEGASEALVERLQTDAVKREKAREAAYEEKRNSGGVSDSDVLDRLRRRRDDWGRL